MGKPLLSPPETPTMVANLPVSVTKSIDNLEVVLQPGARISGRVLIDGRSDPPGPHPLAGAPVFIFPAYPDNRDPGYRIPAVGVDSAGRFQTVGLSGVVRDRSGQLVPAARVIVFPRDRSRWQMLSYDTTPSQLVTDRSGVFQASGAIPGDYLAALATAPPEFWMAPEYLETLVPLATPVRLEPGVTRTLDLRLR